MTIILPDRGSQSTVDMVLGLAQQIDVKVDLLPSLLINTPNQTQVSTLDQLVADFGLIRAGEFRAGTNVEPGDGFTGTRIGWPAFSYSSATWNVVGVNNDVLQFGIRSTDGKAVFGGGNIVLDSSGLLITSSGADRINLQSDGDAFFGSNIGAPATTAFVIFSNAQTYNWESMGAGDVLLGDNSDLKANLLWDVSEGQIEFRGGTTTQGYVDTTGAAVFGAGAVKLNNTGLSFYQQVRDVGDAEASIHFYDKDYVTSELGIIFTHLNTAVSTAWTSLLSNSDDGYVAGFKNGLLELGALSNGTTSDWQTYLVLWAQGDTTTYDEALSLITGKAGSWSLAFSVWHDYTNRKSWLSIDNAYSLGITTSSLFQLASNSDINASGAAIMTVQGLSAPLSLVFNEDGRDLDTRLEGDNDVNLLFIEASTDRVGVGTATPSTKLHVAGELTLDTDLAIVNGGTGASTAATARTNLGLVAGGAGDIWVEKAGDTMTNDLIIEEVNTNPRLIAKATGTGNAEFVMFDTTDGGWIFFSQDGAFNISEANTIGSWIATALSIAKTTRTVTLYGSELLPSGAGTKNLGNASDYWGDVSYKTLTDRGCLGWYDDGVEMPDGTLVSDVAALHHIQKHPTLRTGSGAPRLDYSTMPRHVFRPAPIATEAVYETGPDRESRLRFRPGDKMGDDGAELTALVSIMIGAIKELDARIEKLEH